MKKSVTMLFGRYPFESSGLRLAAGTLVTGFGALINAYVEGAELAKQLGVENAPPPQPAAKETAAGSESEPARKLSTPELKGRGAK